MRARHLAAFAGAVAALAPSAVAFGQDGPAPPAPCNGNPQITDVAGDGHHTSSDVLSAWLTEGAGHLEAVIQVRVGTFVPEHSDAQLNGSGFALVFSLAGQQDYVRTRAAPDGSLSYDYGTYANGTFFTSQGTTTGSVVHDGTGAGTATIDIPAAFGAGPGTLLSGPYVLTYDGINSGVPDWVDHAPGGVDPADPARGADYIVGSCSGPTGGGGSGSAPGAGAVRTTAVQLAAPKRITGTRHVLIAGAVVPARGGVAVTITRRGRRTRTSKTTTESDGSFAVRVSVSDSTQLRAVAEGINSGTLTVDVQSRTRIKVQRVKSGAVTLRGTVDPALPGRALLLRPGSPTVIASAAVAHGAFTFRRRLHGAYQVVYVPSGGHAERSTSNTVHVR